MRAPSRLRRARRDPDELPELPEVGARYLRVGDEWTSTVAVTGYPREVHPGWLQPLLTYPARLDVSLHIDPIHPVVAAAGLKRRLARLESGRRHTYTHGQLADPHTEAAATDAHELAARLARGETRMFRLAVYLTVTAPSAEQLAEDLAGVRALAASLLLDTRPTTYRARAAATTASPLVLQG